MHYHSLAHLVKLVFKTACTIIAVTDFSAYKGIRLNNIKVRVGKFLLVTPHVTQAQMTLRTAAVYQLDTVLYETL